MSEDNNFRVLTARRGYEFILDDLRLTMLSTPPVVESIKGAFNFQGVGIATPMATFGPVPNTLPPGIVFQMGMWIVSENSIVPIRFLHIEPTRVVIDIAGSSDTIDAIYGHLLDLTRAFKAPDGSPLIGPAQRVLAFSEISVHDAFSLDRFLSPALLELALKASASTAFGDSGVLIPAIQLQIAASDANFTGEMGTADGHTFSLTLRASTHPDDRVYFSGAPLETAAHLEFLRSLAKHASDTQPTPPVH